MSRCCLSDWAQICAEFRYGNNVVALNEINIFRDENQIIRDQTKMAHLLSRPQFPKVMEDIALRNCKSPTFSLLERAMFGRKTNGGKWQEQCVTWDQGVYEGKMVLFSGFDSADGGVCHININIDNYIINYNINQLCY